MSYHAEDAVALRLELSSIRARQEVLADALAAAGDELEKLAAENERLRARLRLHGDYRDVVREERDTLRAAILTDLGEHDEMLQLGGSGDFYNCRNVVRGGTGDYTRGGDAA